MRCCSAVLQSPGKLVRQLVQDGEHVVEGQAFAEIEVMKMIQTLASPAAGVISFQVRPQLCCGAPARHIGCCAPPCDPGGLLLLLIPALGCFSSCCR